MDSIKKIALLAGDVILLYGALTLTVLLRYGGEGFSVPFENHLGPFSVVFFLWVFIFYIADLYRPPALVNREAVWKSVGVATAVATVASTILFYLFGEAFQLTPKTNLLLFAVLFLVLDGGWRTATRSVFSSRAANVLMVGSSPLAEAVVAHLRDNPALGYRLVYWLQHTDGASLASLPSLADTHRAGIVLFAQRALKDHEGLAAAYALLPREISVATLMSFYEHLFERAPLEEVDESWFVERITTRHRFYDSAKRVLELAASLFGLVILSPLLLCIAVAVRLTSEGPAIFRQTRIGKLGVPFTLYKFRVMVARHDGAPVTSPRDPRFTALGKFLDFTHLNELPQLWNVVRGDLSLIGPRPESAELVARYRALPHYDLRHAVKPGITGWAQINYKPSASVEEAFVKLSYDFYYLAHRSFMLDLLILLRTVRHFISPAR